MKVMTAMYTLRSGGAYERFIMMLEAFLERNCEIHCLSLTPICINNPFFKNYVIDLPFKLKNKKAIKLCVLLLFPLYSFLIGWRNKIDLFVAFGPLYAFLQAIPKSIMKKPMVTLVRLELSFTSPIPDLSKRFLWLSRVTEYLGLMFSDRIITVNTSIQKDIMKFIKRKNKVKVKVLFNNIPQMKIPVDEDILLIRREFAIPEGAKVLATAGVLTPRKNIEILLICLTKIENKSIYLFVIGANSTQSDFPYQEKLQRLATELGIDRRVIFTGWLENENLRKMYLASDLFVLPSWSEGMPNVMLEALGCNLPCFGSNIGGIKDILNYDELLFDPLDENMLANKLSRYFSDARYCSQIERLCQERKAAFIFDWKEKVFEMVTGAF